LKAAAAAEAKLFSLFIYGTRNERNLLGWFVVKANF